jgi:hypothetical protein
MHIYEVRPRKDRHGVDLISDALPFGALFNHREGKAAEVLSFRRSLIQAKDQTSPWLFSDCAQKSGLIDRNTQSDCRMIV